MQLLSFATWAAPSANVLLHTAPAFTLYFAAVKNPIAIAALVEVERRQRRWFS